MITCSLKTTHRKKRDYERHLAINNDCNRVTIEATNKFTIEKYKKVFECCNLPEKIDTLLNVITKFPLYEKVLLSTKSNGNFWTEYNKIY